MPADMDSQVKAIRRWLESPEGLAMVDRIARSVMKDPRFETLSPEYLKLVSLYHMSRGEILEEIKQELVLFILEKTSLQRRLDLENKKLSTYLKTAFFHHMIDRSRRSGLDPWRIFYKHLAKLLNESKVFHSTGKDRQGTAFSMTSESHPIAPLSEEDFYEIPFPDQMIDDRGFQNINRRESLLALADYFWKKVSSIHEGKPVLVDLRDFVNWMSLHVLLSPLKQEGESTQEWEHVIEYGTVMGSTPDKDSFNPELVKEWAKNFAETLNEKEKQIIYLAYINQVKLKDMAAQLGYRGPSGPIYKLDQVKEKLKLFLRDLPWLSHDDLIEEAFSLFWDTFIFILKKSYSKP